MMDRDKLSRAYVRLNSIRKNLPDDLYIGELLVREYSAALQHLEGLGFDVEEFSIPEDWLKRQVRSKQPFGGGPVVKYADERTVLRTLFVTKLDAVLEYFTVSETKAPIGFRNAG